MPLSPVALRRWPDHPAPGVGALAAGPDVRGRRVLLADDPGVPGARVLSGAAAPPVAGAEAVAMVAAGWAVATTRPVLGRWWAQVTASGSDATPARLPPAPAPGRGAYRRPGGVVGPGRRDVVL